MEVLIRSRDFLVRIIKIYLEVTMPQLINNGPHSLFQMKCRQVK